MPQFLVAIHHLAGYDGSQEDQSMHKDIDDLNDEMVAKGVRFFAGGLGDNTVNTKSVTGKPGGGTLITDGPYLETKEHIGGFWILECANMDEALEWGRKAFVACRAPVEVRQFLQVPTE